ncbi:MAG TPA: ATP-binding protein [Xanthomonadales bacterium]|nr:ATP-binding protein [Xanthomonadales bacterium]
MNRKPEHKAFRSSRSWGRRLLRILPVTALIFSLLIALLLVSGVQQDVPQNVSWGFSALLAEGYLWVLVVTALAVLILLSAIVSRLLSLVRKVKSEEPGARLAARWVRNFLGLSIPPALIVYFFSAWFLSSTIDSWFDVQVEQALADSLALGQQFLDTRTLEVRNQLRETADGLRELREGGDLLRQELLDRVRASGPLELTVMGADGTLLATANINALTGLPERPGDFALLQAQDRGEYAAAEPTADGGLQIRVLNWLPPEFPGDQARILQAIYPLPPGITELASSIEQEYYRYQNVSYLRNSLKQSFLLILSLVLLLTILLAILAALNAARRMVAPLSRLSRATHEVAGGDFAQRVEAGEKDEIGFLVSSFNDMTNALQEASQSAEESRAKLQEQGDYLEAVLGNLSSGVLTLDDQGLIVRANRACRNILGVGAELTTETATINQWVEQSPYLQPLAAAIGQQAQSGRNNWQQEIRLQDAPTPLVLLARGSQLMDHGQVVVFDDVTVLNQAQREAAWAEAARRLAHEVKNPLTPIRLAAERLHMKLANKLDASDSALLDKASSTIVAQVEALRALVDAFGDYAREPVLNRETINLNTLIKEVVTLYQQGDSRTRFDLDLQAGAGELKADAGRLRQLLHNLLRNAQEAAGNDPAQIEIATSVRDFEASSWLQCEIRDHGQGFPDAVLQRPFEPYVTHKPGGSGLGLAICRKIVSEHDGRITLHNHPDGGALVTILLPLAS